MPIDLPNYAQKLFEPFRYKCLRGGRGSAKSHTVARALLTKASEKKMTFLCAREYQNSIKDSVHKLLKEIIQSERLPNFLIQNDKISHTNGSEFIFKGLKENIDSIKSMEAIDIVWIEEGDKVSKESWDVLVPTIRRPESEIWVVYNPTHANDPIHKFFNNPPENALVINVSWRDNPWFPKVLKIEKDYLKRVDYENYLHVWEGKVKKNSNAQVFTGKYEIIDQLPSFSSLPLLGADWGFSSDPTTLIKLYIKDNCLYVTNEAYERGVDIPNLPALFNKIPDSNKYKIYGDSARPEIISYLKKWFNIEPVKKWGGSVEQGVSFLRSFEKIYIHSSCKKTIEEFENYTYKVDKVTGEITTTLIDDFNHCIDAIRYALSKLIQNKKIALWADLPDNDKERSFSNGLNW